MGLTDSFMQTRQAATFLRRGFRISLLLGVGTIPLVIVEKLKPPKATQLWKAVFNSGHAVLFGFFAVSILILSTTLTKRSRPAKYHYYLAFWLSTAVGLLAEALQIYGPRSADIGDFLRNVLGIGSFLLFASTFDGPIVPSNENARAYSIWYRRLVATAILCVAFIPVIVMSTAYVQRASAFPSICRFRAGWEQHFVETSRCEISQRALPDRWQKVSLDSATYVTFHTGRYRVLSFEEPYPDWTGYARLVFTIYLASPEPIELRLRIEDERYGRQSSDRFDETLRIEPGVNRIAIPLAEVRRGPQTRVLDMSRIQRVSLRAVRPSVPFSFYLDGFRLDEEMSR